MSERQALIAGYFDGDLDAAAREELAALLERDAGAAGEFDEALHIEALLRVAHAEPSSGARPATGVRTRARPRRARPRRSSWRLTVAAAAVLAAATGAWLGSRGDAEHEVLSGRVLVDGVAVRRVPDGATLEVAGEGPAVIRLTDGSRAEFSPASRAVLHGRVGELRQVVQLDRGKGSFNVKKGAEKFRVDTPVGQVTVLGTKFSVELRPAASKAAGKLALVAAVVAGSVRVEVDGKAHVLSAGQQRVFGDEREVDRKKPGLPESVRGFSGMVRGIVLAKGEKDTFTFEVGRVLKTWKGNKAGKPEALAGLTVKVGPRWRKDKHGKWHPMELHVLFIRKLKAGNEYSLWIDNPELERFTLLELTGEQAALVRGPGKRDGKHPEGEKHGGEKKEGEKAGLPEGVRGFSGSVRGVVAAKGEKNTFTFKVARVLKIWKDNKARKPEALAGLTIKVGPRWRKDKHGKWLPVELHVLFIGKLKAGNELTLEVRNAEHNSFALQELTREQRARARHDAGKREGKYPEGKKKAGEKGGDEVF